MPRASRTREQLLAALDADEWLLPGDVATVLGIGRTSVHRMLVDGVIGYRSKPGRGRQRLADPGDVRNVLADSEQTRRGEV